MKNTDRTGQSDKQPAMLELRVQGITVIANDAALAPRLQDISFHLAPGDITLLVGKTGAGKSTLLEVLAGLQAPTSGNVYYKGQPLWEKSRPNRALLQEIGIVFQYPEHQLFANTVKQEFDYSLKPFALSPAHKHQRITQALAGVELSPDLLQEFPLTLSGGQKRKVAVGTTLSTQPGWLLLDEPTAGLDSASAAKFIGTLSDYVKRTGHAAMVATHDLDRFLPIAHSILFLQEGRILRHSSIREALSQPALFEAAAIGLPSLLELRIALETRGLLLPAAAENFLTGDENDSLFNLARSIAIAKAALTQPAKGQNDSQTTSQIDSQATSQNTSQTTSQTAAISGNQPAEQKRSPNHTQAPALVQPHTFDGRAKWLFYIFASIGILLQNHWFGVLLASALTFATLRLAQVNLQMVWRTQRPFLYLLITSVALSGLRLSMTGQGIGPFNLHFSVPAATSTLLQTWKLWLLLSLGTGFTAITSQVQMKKALEQAFGGLSKIGLPVTAFALATSLLFRFIPVLGTEQERFSRIARARGKSTGKPGRFRLRDLPAFLIPLVLSLLQLGEDLALAMESRGCAHLDRQRNALPTPRFTKRDWGLSLIGGSVLLTLLLLRGIHGI